jgi:nitrate/nitrite transporter NarK
MVEAAPSPSFKMSQPDLLLEFLIVAFDPPSQLAGVIIGFGLAGSSFTVVIGAFGKLMPPQWRSLAFGAGTATGSFGQFLFSPLAVALIDRYGWRRSPACANKRAWTRKFTCSQGWNFGNCAQERPRSCLPDTMLHDLITAIVVATTAAMIASSLLDRILDAL